MKYVIPVVLVAITTLRLLGTGLLPWQYTGPGAAFVGPTVRAVVLVIEGVALYLVGRYLARRFPSRLRRGRDAQR